MLSEPNLNLSASGAWANTALAKPESAATAAVSILPIFAQVMALVSVAAKKEGAFAHYALANWGSNPPKAGGAVFGDRVSMIWSAPNQYLLLLGADEDVDALAVALAGTAAVTDQSDGRALVEISGKMAAKVLAKGISVDLHPDVFTPGTTAVTALAHVGVQLWKRDASPRFVLAVPRSFAGYIADWLRHAAMEYGFEVAATA